jgi:hypothetical protein
MDDTSDVYGCKDLIPCNHEFTKRENYHWKSGHLAWVKVEENTRWRALGIEKWGNDLFKRKPFFVTCCSLKLKTQGA